MAMSSTKQTVATLAFFSWPAIVYFEFAPLFLYMFGSGCFSLILGLGVLAKSGLSLDDITKSRYPRPKYRPAALWSLLGIVALSQVSVFLVVYAYKTDWEAIKEFSGFISRQLAQLIPAIGAVAQEAKAAEHASRIDVVRDAASMGYFFGLLFALIVALMPLKTTSAGYHFFSEMWDRCSMSFWPNVGAVVFVGTALGLLFHVDLVADEFSVFAATDTDLVYCLWLVPLLFFSSSSVMLRMYAMWLRGRFALALPE